MVSGQRNARTHQARWRVRLLACVSAALAACAGEATPAPPSPSPTPAPTATAQVVVAVVPPTPTPAGSPTPFVLPHELLVGQHLSASGSYTQTETEAAGPMLCRIERDSCAFSQLVINRDPALLFSEGEDPPYGLEDRMMHPGMLLPLSNLAQLVEAEWDGTTQVFITEAYDSLLDHHAFQPNDDLRYSLHFEGRSIDMIPWPPDETRLGRLCALALQAGFVWVHNEGDHCHASISANSLCTVCSARREQ